MSGALPDAHGGTGAHDPAAPERPGFDLRARAVELLVLVASVVVLRVVGLLLIVVGSYGFGSGEWLYPLVAMVIDPNLLVWVALAAAVQFGLRSMRRPGRWGLIVLAAPVAVVLVTVVRGMPGIASVGFAAVLGNGLVWIDAGILTAVVALGVAFSAAFLSRGGRRWSAKIAGALLAVGGLLALLLVWQAFETYFTLFGAPVEVTPADENRYLVTAALTLSALVGAVVFAAISRRRGLIITACVIGCLGLVITFAVPVPADRFTPVPQPAPVDPGGGGGCMGEGDPYCVGG